MAYVHCHTCGWTQDDFWSKKYNPVRSILKHDMYLLRSQYIRVDLYYVQHTKLTLLLRLTTRVDGKYYAHSWLLLWRSLRRCCKLLPAQVWWTQASWQRAIAKNHNRYPNCPACGDDTLDVD
jgi:hypothetical protein